MNHWTEFLRSANGGVEVNRLVGFIGGVALIFYTGYEVIWLKRPFDPLAFAGGVALIVGGTGGAVALKDPNAAKAKVIAETNSNPADPPAPAPEPKPGPTDEVATDDRPSYAV